MLNISSSLQQIHQCPLAQRKVRGTCCYLALSNLSNLVRSTLCSTSSILESLSETAGVQSFLLAIDPNDPSDGGFLGGSLIGREFWRGMRGGGDTGARSFKAFYNSQSQTMARAGLAAERHIPTPPPLKGKPEGSARSLKNELYETVRNALRCVSLSRCRMTKLRVAQNHERRTERRDEVDEPLEFGLLRDCPRGLAARDTASKPFQLDNSTEPTNSRGSSERHITIRSAARYGRAIAAVPPGRISHVKCGRRGECLRRGGGLLVG